MGVITDMVKHFYNGRYKQGFEWFVLKHTWAGYKTTAIKSASKVQSRKY